MACGGAPLPSDPEAETAPLGFPVLLPAFQRHLVLIEVDPGKGKATADLDVSFRQLRTCRRARAGRQRAQAVRKRNLIWS